MIISLFANNATSIREYGGDKGEGGDTIELILHGTNTPQRSNQYSTIELQLPLPTLPTLPTLPPLPPLSYRRLVLIYSTIPEAIACAICFWKVGFLNLAASSLPVKNPTSTNAEGIFELRKT